MSTNKRPELPFWLVLTIFAILAIYPFLDSVATDVIGGRSLGQAIQHQLPAGGLYIAATAFLLDGLAHLWMTPLHYRDRSRAFRAGWLILNSGALLILLVVVTFDTIRYVDPDDARLRAWSANVEIAAIWLSVLWWLYARVLFRHGRLVWFKPAFILMIATVLVTVPVIIATLH
jgi:hypothetical protein